MQSNALIKPLKLAAAISFVSVLTACSGNSSSTSTGPAPIIDHITVDKTMAEVEWTPENYVTNASHAYRVATQNTMMRLVFTNQLAAFDALVNLLRVDSTRNCRNSGRMVATNIPEQCYPDTEDRFDGDAITCTEDSPLRISTQESQAIACQDGNFTGQYFDGFFNTIQISDLTLENEEKERRTSTTISAIKTVEGEDQDGNFIETDFTDYLFQSETSRFFFDNQYESYVDFSTMELECGENKFTTVERQGIRSTEVGTLEGDGSSDFYIYTKLTDLDLQAIPVETCNEDDGQSVVYTYSLRTTMANAVMGGGDNRNTLVTWPDMRISLKGSPSGTMSLIHDNASGQYNTVTVNFTVDVDADLNESVSVVITDSVTSVTHTLADFLELSKPAAE